MALFENILLLRNIFFPGKTLCPEDLHQRVTLMRYHNSPLTSYSMTLHNERQQMPNMRKNTYRRKQAHI